MPEFEELFCDIQRIARKHMGSASRASTVKEALDEITALGPEAVHEVVSGFITGMNRKIGADAGIRAGFIAEAKAMLDWNPDTILESGVVKEWADFDSFLDVDGSPTVQEACDFTRRWVVGLEANTLVLAGPPGVGKTHLAKAAAVQLGELGKEVVYRQESRMIGELQNLMGKQGTSIEACILELCQVRWLVLDEFGATALRDWGEAVIDRIINERWDSSVRTLITTNLLSDQMTPRMRSRLGDVTLAKAIVIKAPDYRQQRR